MSSPRHPTPADPSGTSELPRAGSLEARLTSQFIQNLTHELSTPLTPILGYLQILRSPRAGALTALQDKCIASMETSARRLQHIIDELMEITRLEAGSYSIVLADLDPRDAVRDACSLVHPAAQAKSISMETAVDGATRPIRADRAKVTQALSHVVANAVKFTPEGGKVLIEALPGQDGGVHFAVYDSGVGIPRSELQQIFEPFYQVDGSTTRRFAGLGVGLAIVRRVVDAHGGSWWAESPPAEQPPGQYYKGARVGFALPACARPSSGSVSVTTA